MVDVDTISVRIHDYIVSNFLFDSGDLAYSASLLEEAILDSTGVLEMVMFVEETFSTSVSEDEVVPEHFDSIDALAAFVRDKLAHASDQQARSGRAVA